MSNNIQKQNIFYKGRIYIDCEIEVPDPNEDRRIGSYQSALDLFTRQLSDLVSYPYTGTNLKDGRVVVENIDYELEYQFFVGNPLDDDSWKTTDSREYYLAFDSIKKRILAIPKEQPTEHHRENCPCEICSTIRSAERRDPSNAPDLKKEETQNELWQEVIRMPEPIGTLESLISVFSSKFTITRK